MTPKGLHVGAGAVAHEDAEGELEPGDDVTVAFEVWKNAVCVTCADGVKRPFHGGIVDATVVTVDSTWGRYSRCYAVRVGSGPRAFVALVHHERCAKTAQETEGGGVAKPLCREFRRRAMDDAECAASCARATGDEEARMRLAAVAARAVADRESAATLSRVAHALEGR